jgi:methenyltetrahydromethanopterin cyclohydrolase
MSVKFPNVSVKLAGEDGNVFMILGRVKYAMKREGCTKEEIEEFVNEATSGDYDKVLQTIMKTVKTN